MRSLKKILFLSLLIVAGCANPLPYQDDLGVSMNSAQANDPEFPVFINGTLCKDMDSNAGLCSKRITSKDNLVFHFDPQTYTYDLTITCTDPIGILSPETVPVGLPIDVTVTPMQMKGLKFFICAGQVFPQDRPQPLSASFDVRVVVRDAAFLQREAMLLTPINGKSTLILGAYARKAWVFDQGKWNSYDQKTEIEIKDPVHLQAMSESYLMRYNFMDFVGPIAAAGQSTEAPKELKERTQTTAAEPPGSEVREDFYSTDSRGPGWHFEILGNY